VREISAAGGKGWAVSSSSHNILSSKDYANICQNAA
jgi:hypothetical protein